MFHSARIQLTAWYFLIITLISVSFSVAIYHVLTSELDRVEQLQRARIQNSLPRDEERRFFYLDPALVSETKNRLKLVLIFINVVILGASTAGGYFLAGKTLKPIAHMVDDQNRFISDASHELRTPLTSIKTEIEVSLRGKKLNFSSAKKLLKSNLEEVDKIQRLTTNLLTLNKFQGSSFTMTKKKLSLKSVVEKAYEKIKSMAKSKTISIQKDLKNVTVYGNEDSFVELATILLDNAVKYSKSGGKVIVRTKRELGNVILEVQDFGVGIKASDLPHIFDRFYRVEPSRNKNKTDGFGLGLSIAKNIAEAHQGSISVKSAPGKGSTFTATFPVRVA